MDQIRIYRSAVLPADGFLHGFPERTGGVSVGARHSLNLGMRWGDDREAVLSNRQRLADHVGFDVNQLQVTKHVHGTAVWKVGESLPEPAEFDGLVCDHAGPVLGAFAADCVPMLLADPVSGVIGACHAGWRGTVGGVAARVVERMIECGARPGDIRVALGPSIGACCFEVGPEVVTPFVARFPNVPQLVVAGPRKDHIDLRIANRAVLSEVGIRPEHIDDRPPCTRCEPARFFSYRRDGQAGGVHMGFIGRRAQ